jgi:hypothetical protein
MVPQLVLAIADRAQSQQATTKKQPHLSVKKNGCKCCGG